MDDYLKEALEIVKAQAKVRVMSEEVIISMVQKLAEGIRDVCMGTITTTTQQADEVQPLPVRKSIKEQSIVCLECGKSFKILTKKHLASHDLDADSYREKWGIKRITPLVCKSLQRERRKKMNDMKLWERRKRGA